MATSAAPSFNLPCGIGQKCMGIRMVARPRGGSFDDEDKPIGEKMDGADRLVGSRFVGTGKDYKIMIKTC